MPNFAEICLLYSRTAIAAQFAPLGWALITRALPAAIMLIALQVSVGMLCVTGVMQPMTPNGAYSSRHRPLLPLKALVLQEFDAGNSFEDLQLFDLVIEPADLRFIQLELAPFLGLLLGDRFDQLDDAIAVVHREAEQFLLRIRSRPRRLRSIFPKTPNSPIGTPMRCGCRSASMAFGIIGGGIFAGANAAVAARPSVSQSPHDFGDHILNKCLVHDALVHGCLPVKRQHGQDTRATSRILA